MLSPCDFRWITLRKGQCPNCIRATSPHIPMHQMSWATAQPEVTEVFEIHADMWEAQKWQADIEHPWRSDIIIYGTIYLLGLCG